ncbi:MAG: hypothetical protein Q9181_005934 [Wetmoreana brouardii]
MELGRYPESPNDEKTMRYGSQSNQQAMIEACESGNFSGLQQLLQACDVKERSAPVAPKYGEPEPPPSAPPPTWKLITAAVRHARPSILALLLKTYPTVDLHRQSILDAALANPHLETFKLLHAHSPSIVNYEFESLNTSLLMESCRGGNPLLPNYLLDNGADPNEGGFPGAGPLFYAVQFDQPIEVVKKMVDRGAVVTKAVWKEANRKQGILVSDFLLK